MRFAGTNDSGRNNEVAASWGYTVYTNNSLHWRENMLGYLSTGIICSEKRTAFRERSARKTESFEEQIMSKDKYPSIFSPQMKVIVFIILLIFFAVRAVLKIGEYSRIFSSFSWGIFGHVKCLDQSRASENFGWITCIRINSLEEIESRDHQANN